MPSGFTAPYHSYEDPGLHTLIETDGFITSGRAFAGLAITGTK